MTSFEKKSNIQDTKLTDYCITLYNVVISI